MVEVKSCPVCGANSFKSVLEAPYFRGDGELFSIKECESCKLWVTSPRPEDSELGRYYDPANYISHSDKKEGVIDYLYHMVRTYSLKKKVSLIEEVNNGKGSLLDFGAGTGYFATAAKNKSWEVFGVEPSAEARKVAKDSHGLELFDPGNERWFEGSYDVITLWHVLEHLPDLRGHLSRFAECLKKGGALIIAVPNHESWDSEYYREHWAALDVPLHLYHFKKENIEMLAGQFGFKLENIRNMPFDSFYVSLLSEKIKQGKTKYVNALLRGLKSNMKGLSDKNASSLIYILRKPH